MSSSSKSQKVKVSEGEKIQAQLAKDQYAEYQNTYVPLEGEYLSEATKDHSARLSAQAGTASMRTSAAGLQNAATSSGPVDTGAISSALTNALMNGYRTGKTQQFEGGINSMKQGLGATADASQSLTSASQDQLQVATSDAQAAAQVANAKAQTKAAAIGALGSIGGAYGINKYMQGAQAKTAADTSMKLGASQAGYGPEYLSGWKGPTR
ncbi:hypothetical protein VPH49_21975 [Pseudomonas luteola]|uniref:hypothetical protein n=1 Tax=Pseudomonas luteola TaxID=47886 RepID=UPI003A8B0CBE